MIIEYTKNQNQKYNYAVVFDMDETLGHFTQLYVFWNLIKSYLDDYCLHERYFFAIIDMFSDFLRPNIIKLLNNIKRKKKRGICNYVMIYTNNNGPKYWAELIKAYFHYRIDYELFDKIIGAFKIDGNVVEICRTSHGKSHRDFINCTKLPKNTKICFLDDQTHKEMEHENVLYINIEPYTHNEEFDVMAEKFYKKFKSLFIEKNPDNTLDKFVKYIKKYTQHYNLKYINKSKIIKNIDYILGNEIIKKMDEFFKSKPRKSTRKKKKTVSSNRFTKRNA